MTSIFLAAASARRPPPYETQVVFAITKHAKKTVEQSFQRNTGAASEDLEKDMNQELTQLLNVYNSRTAALNNKDIR